MLEIGGGLGRALGVPRRARRWHVHVIEIDERLREPLRRRRRARERDRALGRRDDARPAPRCARRPTRSWRTFPMGSPRRVLLRTIEELDGVERVGGDGPARGRRAPGRRARAAASTGCTRCSPSSPARCGCCARSRARCSHPVAERRLGARAASRRYQRRRRPRRRCARSSAARSPTGARRSPARCAAPGRARRRAREQVRAALVALGHPADVRAERLARRSSWRWRGALA